MLSQHALQVVSQHALQQVSKGYLVPGRSAPAMGGRCLVLGGSALGGMPGPRGSAPGGVAFCYGLLLSSVMPFYFGGLLIEDGLLV